MSLAPRIAPQLTLALLLAFAAGPQAAQAHGGEDHGEDHGAAASAPVAGAPTASLEAHSELFELVGRAQQHSLILYLDRYADNSPVLQARLEVESGAWRAVASAAADGRYQFELPAALLAPGEHPLIFTITAGKDSDLLEATLQQPRPAVENPHGGSRWRNWGLAAAAAALSLIAGVCLRRRALRRQQGSHA